MINMAVLNLKDIVKYLIKITLVIAVVIGLTKYFSTAKASVVKKAEELEGKQIVAVINFPPRQIAEVKSEVLVLGTDSEQGIILLRPTLKVENGDKVC